MTEEKEERITTRAVSQHLDGLIGVKHPVLDHGHIIVLDYMGNDDSIVQAARTSYKKGTKTVSDNQGLLNYLMKNRHTTPFEMCELKIHVKLPIFVARQWIRHRTANVNEMSARYSVLSKEFYIPKIAHCAAQSTTNKQGRGALLEHRQAEEVRQQLIAASERGYELYTLLLGEDDEGNEVKDGYGLARELSRMALPLNFYTEWVWKVDLHNLLHFLGLRADPHAQYEIRAYANILMDEIVSKWVPQAYQAFIQHRYGAMTLSQTEAQVVCEIIHRAVGAGTVFDWDAVKTEYKLSDRFVTDLKKKLSLYGDGHV